MKHGPSDATTGAGLFGVARLPTVRRQHPNSTGDEALGARGPATPLKWIRFHERHPHGWHAALGYDYGGYWTACGRFVRSTGITDIQDANPRNACACCRVRLKLPYLLHASVDEVFGVRK